MTVPIMIAVFVVSMITAAWVVPRKRAARKDREAADDAAIKDLYDHYLVGIDALTQAYLVRAPSDEEWLAGMKARAGKPETAWPPEFLEEYLRVVMGRLESRSLWLYVLRTGIASISGAGMAVICVAGIAVAVAYAVVRLAEWSLPSLLGIAVTLTLGSLAGRVIGLRHEVSVGWWRRKT